MNQWIEIDYKPDWYSDPNYWNIWFFLDKKVHREKIPSSLDSNGNWLCFLYGKLQKRGKDFDWNKE